MWKYFREEIGSDESGSAYDNKSFAAAFETIEIWIGRIVT